MMTVLFVAAIKSLADRVDAQRAHTASLILFRARHRLVAIDNSDVPHSPGAIVEHHLPAFLTARRDDDDRTGVSLGRGNRWSRGGRLLAQRGPATRVPIRGIDENGGAEGEPDEQHVSARNIAQHPATVGRFARGHGVAHPRASSLRDRSALFVPLRPRKFAGSYAGKVQLMQRLIAFSFAAVLAATDLVLVQASGAAAADYPNRPPHIIVGYPAGGSTDIIARLIGDWL